MVSSFLDLPDAPGISADANLILFDIDGTLIDTGGAGGKAFRAALTAEFEIASPRGAEMNGCTDFGILQELLTNNGIDVSETNMHRLRSRYFHLLPDLLSRLDGRVLAGVQELLQAIARCEDCQLGLLTGNDPKSARMKLEHYGIHHFFDWGVFGHRHLSRLQLGRFAAESFRQRFGQQFDPTKVVVIGDTPLDIACAREIGCRVLAVATGKYSCEELESHAPCRLEADLTNTDSILQWLDRE